MCIINKNKLVRDKIPDIIRSQNYTCKVHTLSQEKYREELKNKIIEEAKELSADYNLEECADVYEVLLAICEDMGYQFEDLLKVAKEKRKKKGAFKEKIFLESYFKNKED